MEDGRLYIAGICTPHPEQIASGKSHRSGAARLVEPEIACKKEGVEDGQVRQVVWSSLDHVRRMQQHEVHEWLTTHIKEAALPSALAAPSCIPPGSSRKYGSSEREAFVGLGELDGHDLAELCLLGRSVRRSLGSRAHMRALCFCVWVWVGAL